MSETLINDNTQKCWFRVRIMQIFSVSIAHTSSSVFSIAQWSHAIDSNEASCGFRINREQQQHERENFFSEKFVCIHTDWLSASESQVAGNLTSLSCAGPRRQCRLLTIWNSRVFARERMQWRRTRRDERKEQTLKSFMSPSLDLSLSCGIFGYFYGCTR